ncbi:hypothetical protein [Novosphingobium sp. Gsoil 351]|uniref:hypothetical protein n=1 Tax=Novosphingobium sp. Gsoil 351 TaxID=2675225 RepID=UPI0012B4699F|nr:hypothetical protein [Novosphingobium sp. Gsoil 351]QGN53484.1 hypothetical protein GKE62_01900 [Novosphingobium sp. Gsoil 351]
MGWSWSRLGLAAAALTVSTGVSASASAQAIVVRASGPSAAKFPKGMKLPAGTSISLQDGDVVTVLDRVGTRVMKGKATLAVDNQVLRDRGLVPMLTRSLSNPRTIRAGAVRGMMAPGLAPALPTVPKSVWVADIDKGGKVCVPQGSGLYLWRGNNAAQRLSWLSEADGGAMVRLQFPPRTSGISWPGGSLPLVSGRSYRINGDDAEPAVEFEVVSLAPDAIPDNAAELGGLLLANGCAVQFDMLADSLADGAGTAE